MLQRSYDEALATLSSVKNLTELDLVRVEYLGKNGVFTNFAKEIVNLPIEERKNFGANLNEKKNKVQLLIEERKLSFEQQELLAKLADESVDISQPPRLRESGKIHPISRVIEEIIEIFEPMGFDVANGPDIDSDYYNFGALNFQDHHPARQMQDSFYIKEDKLLRTHTSNVQIRAMESGQPPFYLISPGRVYRCDWDQTHTPMFHQIEVICIDKNINFQHLKGSVISFLKQFFENEDLNIRFRPSYFPFVEPGAEVDIGCARTKNELKIGTGSDWLEILGCGMVHPNVLRNVGISSDEYRGFAIGMGVERLAMLKYGISDLRTFFESDIRWGKHYGFNAFEQ